MKKISILLIDLHLRHLQKTPPEIFLGFQIEI